MHVPSAGALVMAIDAVPVSSPDWGGPEAHPATVSIKATPSDVFFRLFMPSSVSVGGVTTALVLLHVTRSGDNRISGPVLGMTPGKVDERAYL
jgi:hypothetical protein